MNDFEEVVSQLRTAVLAAGNDPDVSGSDLRDILAFLVKVTQVVDQSFQDIYALAVELAYLESSEVDGGAHQTPSDGIRASHGQKPLP
ncbi:hypothetical protein GOC68_25555 [Sinorhizobium medicae]|nr:hypothetical protein [Sinorhizobium medicae]